MQNFFIEENIIIQEGRMFYSPSKQFVRFTTYRLTEIKDLKERIHKEKLSYEDLSSTQMRLEKLKKHYDFLQAQSHTQLKQVLKNSQTAIDELMHQKFSYQRSIKIKSQEIASLQQMKGDYQTKGVVIQEKLRLLIHENDELKMKKTRNDELILSLDKEYQDWVRQCQRQRLIEEEIKQTQVDLNKKWKHYEEQHTKTKQNDTELAHKIELAREEMARLKQEAELFTNQTQKNQILIQKAKLSKELLSFKIEKIECDKARHLENTAICAQQVTTEGHLQQINQKMLEQTKNAQLEQLHCQKQLKKILQKVQKQEQQKCKWQQTLQKTKIHLSLIKQKNENLKNKLNFIFKSDSELIKTITSKKVYPNCKPQLIEVLKKSAMQPFQSKENIQVLASSQGKFQKKYMNNKTIERII